MPVSEDVYSKSFSITDIFLPKKKYYKAADLNEIEINEMKLVKLKGRQIALCRSEEGYFALNDRCPHKGYSLSKGVMICNTVHCIRHGSQFDVRTGNYKAGPAGRGVETYNVSVREDGIYILV